MVKILVVGQIPPPIHGQAVMIEQMLNQNYDNVELLHVRMSFSKEADEIGQMRFGKLFHLLVVIMQIYWVRIKSKARILYYPPADPNFVPVMRDLAILCCTRWLFDVTIFHFHAAGVSGLYPSFSPLLQFFFRRAYFSPEIVVRISEYNPQDGKALGAKREFVIPCCALDVPLHPCDRQSRARVAKPNPLSVLYVGQLYKERGINDILDALTLLRERGHQVQAQFMGGFRSSEYEQEMSERISAQHLAEQVEFLGVLSGEPKHAAFCHADIFCFPSFCPVGIIWRCSSRSNEFLVTCSCHSVARNSVDCSRW